MSNTSKLGRSLIRHLYILLVVSAFFRYVTNLNGRAVRGLAEARCKPSVSLLPINSADRLVRVALKLLCP